MPLMVMFLAIAIAAESTMMSDPKTMVSPAAALVIAVTKADFEVIPVTVAAWAVVAEVRGTKRLRVKENRATNALAALRPDERNVVLSIAR